MPGRRPFRSGRSGGGIHNKEWEAVCLAPTTLDIAVGTLVAFVMFIADEAETLLRSRGRFRMVLNAAAIDESVTIAVGLAIVSARAAAAGVASLPRPATEGSYPWLWHDFGVASTFQGQASGTFAQVIDMIVDSKAMRKVKEDEVMVFVVEVCSSVDGGGSLQIDGGLRALTGD